MIVPCEYCGTLTDGDVFMRLGVPACCASCSVIPRTAAVVGVMFLAFLALLAISPGCP